MSGETSLDPAGALRLFGGLGRDASPANEGLLHDLWEYLP